MFIDPFLQFVNASAILLGVGLLSEPLAFAYAGWLPGAFLVMFYGYLTCYTGKFLARIALSDPRIRTYADIGQMAFGPASASVISVCFSLELFTFWSVLFCSSSRSNSQRHF